MSYKKADLYNHLVTKTGRLDAANKVQPACEKAIALFNADKYHAEIELGEKTWAAYIFVEEFDLEQFCNPPSDPTELFIRAVNI